MKALSICFLLGISLSNISSASTFCVAKDEIIPYSPFSRFSTKCNRKDLEVTAFFGKNLEVKFKNLLNANDLKVILELNDRMLISTKSRSDLAVDELCLVTKSVSSYSHYVDCDNGQSLSLSSAKAEVVINFAKSYNYKILQSPVGKETFFVIGR